LERRGKRFNQIWLTEEQTPNMKLSLRVNRVLVNKKSDYQEILLVETAEYGRMLVLDGAIQIGEREEFCYSEMMAHIPLCAHPDPKHVLIVGGGDGGVLREVLRHKNVEKAVLIDIDSDVIEAAKEYLPTLSCAMDDPRAEIRSEDALSYIRSVSECFDVAIVDSTDPVDFAAGLFESSFYEEVKKALKKDGIIIAQTESPFSDTKIMIEAYKNMKSVYPITSLCWGAMPTYPSGMWTYTIGSKEVDPSTPRHTVPEGTKYYTRDIHKAAFVLPPFLKDLLHDK